METEPLPVDICRFKGGKKMETLFCLTDSLVREYAATQFEVGLHKP